MEGPEFKAIEFADMKMPAGYSLTEGSLFPYTEEERAFRLEVRKFAQQELSGIGLSLHSTLRDLKKKDSPRTVVRDAIREHYLEASHRMAQAGYCGLLYPTEIGGSDKGVVYETIMEEEFASESAGAHGFHAVSMFASVPILRHGTERQREEFLKPVVQGDKLAAIAITEPQVGSDTARMQTRAVLDGDDYVINGEKRFITNGGVSDFVTVFAVTNPDVHPHVGVSTFIVPADTAGFEVVKNFELMGDGIVDNTHLRLTDCRVPRANLVGKENAGFIQLMEELDTERVTVCGSGIGGARKSYEIALEYSTKRVQFKKPISQFEGISFKLAEMYTRLETARLLTLRAARMIDAGLRCSKESAAAKLYTTEACLKVADDAIQVLGGIGYTKEFPVEAIYRGFRIATIGGGSSEIMKFLISRENIAELKAGQSQME